MPGLKFYKLDLHVHTPASDCYQDKSQTAEQIVQAARGKGLAGIAITDHNTAGWVDTMKQVGESNGLVIFPGVEISLEHCHLVAIFDPTANQKHLENFLGALDIQESDYGKTDTVCTKSVYEVVEKIHERGGLAILAHIDQPKGIFHDNVNKRDDGKISVPAPLSKIFNEAKYDAVECADGKLPLGFDVAHHIKRVPAIFQASDNPYSANPKKHSFDGIGLRYSHFKLDRIDLEGLRQCFVDSEPEVRIWLMEGYQEARYPKIVSLRMGENGFLRNQKFEFHQGLNSLIGGQGVGKSLAIEFLRFGLGQATSDPKLLEDHIGKLMKRLENNNTIQIIYELPDGSQYRIERTFIGIQRGEKGPIVESTVKCVNLATNEEYLGDISVRFPILSYSQTEVIKIAESKYAQLDLIDHLIGPSSHEQDIVSLHEKLRENDIQLDKALHARSKLESCMLEINTVQAQIDTINATLSNPLFETMRVSEQKKNAFDERRLFIHGLIESNFSWQEQVQGLVCGDLSEVFKQDQSLLQQQETALNAKNLVVNRLTNLSLELSQLEAIVQEGLNSWLPEYNQIVNGYNKLLTKIGGDLESKDSERKRLEGRKVLLERDASIYRSLIENLQPLLDKRNELLDKLEETHSNYYEVRQGKFEQLNQLSDGKLNLVLDHAADREGYEIALLDTLKGGQNSPSVSDRRKIAQSVMPRRLVELVVARDIRQLANDCNITDLWAERVIEKFWSEDDFTQVLALQYNCYPCDVPTISFRKEAGDYAELSELSVGQKCTALLIIALCDGAMPVVIDQPEDALDLTSVWNDISKKLRRGKNFRQFILTTHNSSVAVGADSDQFIVLEASARYGRILVSGAIDRPEVKSVVLNNLEGGPEPYKLRYLKYNLPQ